MGSAERLAQFSKHVVLASATKPPAMTGKGGRGKEGGGRMKGQGGGGMEEGCGGGGGAVRSWGEG